jgi:wyosine [tRNA(Phe)-imidazoG37] synthetase (radical SAM superfamily)
MEENKSIIFGPVPSRRLGHSLGINNIPPKVCTYSCIYCQLGKAVRMQVERQPFYGREDILHAVRNKIKSAGKSGEKIDYLTFVPDGEPTLDINLGLEIDMLKAQGIPIAVITNNSLIWQDGVRRDLMKADWVSLKVDSIEEQVWRYMNRPHKKLDPGLILEGALKFASSFKGKLVTETMLVKNINDTDQDIGMVADFLSRLKPDISYLAIPTRPPAEKWAQPPDENVINRAYHLLGEKVNQVEYLTGYEGNAFASTGNVEADIMSITAVHPMRKDAVDVLLERSGTDWEVVDNLLSNNKLIETEYGGHKFYLRKFNRD